MLNPKFKHYLAKKSQGFSLLELLVVIGLLGVVAITATTLLIDTGEEKRKDATEKNWDAIRKAIVGDSTQSLNGSPYLSGYVADMGRLPNNIKELMSLNVEVDLDGDDVIDLVLPAQPNWQAISLNDVVGASGTLGAIYGGWRGPYLYSAGSKFFRDGWGNDSNAATGAINATQFISGTAALTADEQWVVEDKLNFGWNVAHSPTLSLANRECGEQYCEDMIIQSLGQGNNLTDATNPNDSLDYSGNFPNLSPTIVNKNEWLQGATVSFDIVFNTAVSQTGLDLRVFNFEDDGVEDGTGTPANIAKDSIVLRSSNLQTEEYYPSAPSSPVAVSSTFTSGVSTTTVAVSITDDFPIGRYAAVVMCTVGTPQLTDDVIFDGDCDNSNTKSAYFFVLQANTTKVTIPWNIP